jgi:hypothetical protein
LAISSSAGKFSVWLPKDEKGHQDNEDPNYDVTIARVAVSKYEVTIAQISFDRPVAALETANPPHQRT